MEALHLGFHEAVGKSKHHTRSERKRITNVIDGIGLRGTSCKFRTRSHLDSSAIYSTTVILSSSESSTVKRNNSLNLMRPPHATSAGSNEEVLEKIARYNNGI